MLTRSQNILKRLTDIVLAIVGLVLFGWLAMLAMVIAWVETGRCGLFTQKRVGRDGRLFSIYKIRTMFNNSDYETTVTTEADPRITSSGRLFRRTKIDELPQLLNVLVGDMSIVGPRPDVPELAAQLAHIAPLVLSVRPGITGPATLKYRCEEQLLADETNPEWVNNEVIFSDKILLNEAYVANYEWLQDFKYMWQTVIGSGNRCTSSELKKLIATKRQSLTQAA